MRASIAPAQTDDAGRQEKVERIAKMAVTAVYDRYCSGSVADLEEAVVDFVGLPIPDEEDGIDLPSTPTGAA